MIPFWGPYLKKVQLMLIIHLPGWLFVVNSISDSRLSSKPALVEDLCVLCLKLFPKTVQNKYFGYQFLLEKCFQSMSFSVFINASSSLSLPNLLLLLGLYFHISFKLVKSLLCYFQTAFVLHYWIHAINFLTLFQLIHSHH